MSEVQDYQNIRPIKWLWVLNIFDEKGWIPQGIPQAIRFFQSASERVGAFELHPLLLFEDPEHHVDAGVRQILEHIRVQFRNSISAFSVSQIQIEETKVLGRENRWEDEDPLEDLDLIHSLDDPIEEFGADFVVSTMTHKTEMSRILFENRLPSFFSYLEIPTLLVHSGVEYSEFSPVLYFRADMSNASYLRFLRCMGLCRKLGAELVLTLENNPSHFQHHQLESWRKLAQMQEVQFRIESSLQAAKELFDLEQKKMRGPVILSGGGEAGSDWDRKIAPYFFDRDKMSQMRRRNRFY